MVAAFLLIAAWQLQMHPDEVLSYRSTNGDLAFTLNIQMSVHDNQAPLWFVSFWAWRQTVGDAEFTSRVFGVLSVMLALALTYRLGRRWFRSDWVGLLAPLLLIGNGLFFNYALDIRPYPMVMLSAALSMWAFTLLAGSADEAQRAVLRADDCAAALSSLFADFSGGCAGDFLAGAKAAPARFRAGGAGGHGWGGAVAALAADLPESDCRAAQIETQSGTARGVAGIGVSTLATTPSDDSRPAEHV